MALDLAPARVHIQALSDAGLRRARTELSRDPPLVALVEEELARRAKNGAGRPTSP